MNNISADPQLLLEILTVKLWAGNIITYTVWLTGLYYHGANYITFLQFNYKVTAIHVMNSE